SSDPSSFGSTIQDGNVTFPSNTVWDLAYPGTSTSEKSTCARSSDHAFFQRREWVTEGFLDTARVNAHATVECSRSIRKKVEAEAGIEPTSTDLQSVRHFYNQ
ncbi:MAG: hypothetical protein KIS75_13575, partial [Chromatiales bacterium]|nr:hypothetical protein [Chromatiales bacterium]